MDKHITDPNELRYWMETYHSNWLESRNHLITFIQILREDLTDLEKVNKIKDYLDKQFPNQKINN